ncbi:MAG: DUF1624 domain-containing protein [Hyphomonas sp.]|nr:DUF1624 domain-containing protein [Hyphomonas sp.]
MKRINYIDASRGLAVILAMMAHSMIHYVTGIQVMIDAQVWIQIVTRTATPTFMVLFGIMIELVYLRRLREGAPADRTVTRLLERMITCYVLFFLVMMAGAVTGKFSFTKAFLAIAYFETGNYGVILQIYAVLFAIIAATLGLARRWGSLVYAGIAGLGWALKFTLEATHAPAIYPLQYLIGYGFGFGPAILPGMTLVAFGALVGEMLTGRRARFWAPAIGAGAMAVVLWNIATSGLHEYARLVTDVFRWNNDVFYYTFGIAVSSLSLIFFAGIDRARKGAAPGKFSLAALGRDTLYIYGGGNIFLNLLPGYTGQSHLAFLAVAAFLCALMLSSIYKPQVSQVANRLSAGWISRIYRGYKAVCSRIILGLRGNRPLTPPAT